MYQYDTFMNDALISNNFSTSSLSANITLEFELSAELWDDNLIF